MLRNSLWQVRSRNGRDMVIRMTESITDLLVKMLYMCVCVCIQTHTQTYVYMLILYMYIHTGIYMGFSGGKAVNKPPANTRDSGDVGSIPQLGRSPRGGHGNSLQYSCLENSMDSGAWQAIIHGVTKDGTQLSPHAHRYTLYTYALYIHMYFPDGSGVKSPHAMQEMQV